MSSPHFYQGYPGLVEAVEGMKPNESLHRTYLNYEPITGLLLHGHQRLQINVLATNTFLNKTSPLRSTNNFLPIMFLDEEASVDEGTAQKLNHEVFERKYALLIAQYVLIGGGAALILHASMLLVMLMWKKYDDSSYGEFINPPN